MEPEKAVEHFRRAAELNSQDPNPWLELAAAALQAGREMDAAIYLLRADSLAPRSPFVHWPIANFYILRGDIDAAFRHMRVVLNGTSRYDGPVFRAAWKASGDPEKILQELIPRRLSTAFSYLNYLLLNDHMDATMPLWKRIVESDDTFTPQMASPFIERLIERKRPDEAFSVWNDLVAKGLIRGAGRKSTDNILNNGDFEEEILNMGFDWRITPVDGVFAGRDSSTYRSPSRSLVIRFDGKDNVNYAHVFQFVKVSPNRAYRLQAVARSEGITTDSGPRLEVFDPYNPTSLLTSSEEHIGTRGWTPLILDFKTGPMTELLIVRIRRVASRKLDSHIKGRFWIDDVRLTPLEEEAVTRKLRH
jgi:hypothetical protein